MFEFSNEKSVWHLEVVGQLVYLMNVLEFYKYYSIILKYLALFLSDFLLAAFQNSVSETFRWVVWEICRKVLGFFHIKFTVVFHKDVQGC